jgi:predicted DNA-binding transcriptional regulator YafY
MFSGWCALRRDFRSFRLDRVAALSVSVEAFEEDMSKGLAAVLPADSRAHRAL